MQLQKKTLKEGNTSIKDIKKKMVDISKILETASKKIPNSEYSIFKDAYPIFFQVFINDNYDIYNKSLTMSTVKEALSFHKLGKYSGREITPLFLTDVIRVIPFAIKYYNIPALTIKIQNDVEEYINKFRHELVYSIIISALEGIL